MEADVPLESGDENRPPVEVKDAVVELRRRADLRLTGASVEPEGEQSLLDWTDICKGLEAVFDFNDCAGPGRPRYGCQLSNSHIPEVASVHGSRGF
ncbi:hypothetical protein Y032_0004g1937 [Ancylostoma ceylanicum]|nr:hypothetical protein Y032_0004g1937 [Ancylostoma ceylanicum]